MKAVLLSIKPQYCELIASGKKTMEVRKSKPNLKPSFKCYIYCVASDLNRGLVVGGGSAKQIICCNYKTAIPIGGVIGNGKVIGEFICDGIINLHDKGGVVIAITDYKLEGCCLNYQELHEYANGKALYGWHILDLKIYDKPKDLSNFQKPGGKQCVSDNGRCCQYLKAAPDDNPVDQNTMSCIYGGENCPFEHLSRPPQSWCYVQELE